MVGRIKPLNDIEYAECFNAFKRVSSEWMAIGADNKTLYLVEFDSGYDLGTIISEDEIELVYLEDGERAQISLERFYRIK